MTDFDLSYNSLKKRYNPHLPTLKKVLKISGFFSYLFKQKRKIKNWNRLVPLIQFSSFGMQLNLTKEFKLKLDMLFFEHLSKLSPYIKEILKNGWRKEFLSIWEYNIIVNFKSFYDAYYQVVKEKEIIQEDFFRLERAYIRISYREYYIDRIKTVFEKYLITNNDKFEKNKEKYEEILQNLSSFFDIQYPLLSLRELILTYNINKYRTFYKWEDVFSPLNEDIVQKKWYNCSREVFQSILSYYKELRENIDGLNRENIDLLRLKNNCNTTDSDSPSFLIQFYEKMGHKWNFDKSNYHLIFILLIKGLRDDLYDFIYKKWELQKENETTVQQFLIMDKDLPQLYLKLKRELERVFVIFNSDSSISTSVEDFRDRNTPETNVKFVELLSTIFEVSQILQAYSDIALESEYKKNKFLKYMILSPEEWIGKPVFALFNYYIELIWTICSFFRYETFHNLDDRLSEIDEILRSLIEEKKRIDSYHVIDSFIPERSDIRESPID